MIDKITMELASVNVNYGEPQSSIFGNGQPDANRSEGT